MSKRNKKGGKNKIQEPQQDPPPPPQKQVSWMNDNMWNFQRNYFKPAKVPSMVKLSENNFYQGLLKIDKTAIAAPKVSRTQAQQYNLAQKISSSTPKNFLHLYPQWAAHHVKPSKPQQPNLAQQRTNKNSQILNRYADHFKSIKWDQKRQQWTGQDFRKLVRKDNRGPLTNYKSRYQNQSLLQTSLPQNMFKQQIPFLIQQIVLANSVLSDVGFGPVSKNSLSLYAGRWFNSKTGRVQLLPKAKMTLVNPLDRRQKIAYLQARLINHWNQYLKISEQYIKLTQVNNSDYLKAAQKRIEKDVKNYNNPKLFYTKLGKLWKKYLLKSLPNMTYTGVVFSAILAMNSASQLMKTWSQDATTNQIIVWLRKWDKIVKSALDIGIQQIQQYYRDRQQYDDISSVLGQQIKSLISAAASLLWEGSKRYIPLFRRLWRSVYLPTDISAQQVVDVTNKQKQLSRQLKNLSYYAKSQQNDFLSRAINAYSNTIKGMTVERLKKLSYTQYKKQYDVIKQKLSIQPPSTFRSSVQNQLKFANSSMMKTPIGNRYVQSRNRPDQVLTDAIAIRQLNYFSYIVQTQYTGLNVLSYEEFVQQYPAYYPITGGDVMQAGKFDVLLDQIYPNNKINWKAVYDFVVATDMTITRYSDWINNVTITNQLKKFVQYSVPFGGYYRVSDLLRDMTAQNYFEKIEAFLQNLQDQNLDVQNQYQSFYDYQEKRKGLDYKPPPRKAQFLAQIEELSKEIDLGPETIDALKNYFRMDQGAYESFINSTTKDDKIQFLRNAVKTYLNKDDQMTQ